MSLNPVNWTLPNSYGQSTLGRPSEGIQRPMEFLEPPRAEFDQLPFKAMSLNSANLRFWMSRLRISLILKKLNPLQQSIPTMYLEFRIFR